MPGVETDTATCRPRKRRHVASRAEGMVGGGVDNAARAKGEAKVSADHARPIRNLLQSLHWFCNTAKDPLVRPVSDQFKELAFQQVFFEKPLHVLGQLPSALIWEFLGMKTKFNFNGDTSADMAIRVALTSGCDTTHALQTQQRLLSTRPPVPAELQATVHHTSVPAAAAAAVVVVPAAAVRPGQVKTLAAIAATIALIAAGAATVACRSTDFAATIDVAETIAVTKRRIAETKRRIAESVAFIRHNRPCADWDKRR